MLAEGLAILQGAAQLQTAQVGQQANGFGSTSKWRITTPGTSLYVNAATGITLANAVKNATALAQLGSSVTPFASLEELLASLAAPATAAAWSAPRNIFLGPGNYTVGAQIVKRSLNFIFDPFASITDTVMCESTEEAAVSHGAVGPANINFLCPTGLGISRSPCLPGGIQVDQQGASARAVNLGLEGIRSCVVNIGAGVNGGLTLVNAAAALHAPALPFRLDVHNGTIEGATLECEAVLAVDCVIQPTGVTCVAANECRLYSTRFDTPGIWTGGTLRIDTSTNFDFVNPPHGPWVKAAPGGAAPILMV